MIAQIKMRRGTTAEWAAASPVVLATGEPGWDSTLEGMKVGDGLTEWAALPWIDAKNNHDIRLGQNILHNWDFRNPVNQRGASGTISTAGYFYDRWRCGAPGITVTSGYVALGLNGSIEQKMELNLRGLVFTATVLLSDGTFHAGTGMFPVVNGPSNFVDLGGYRVVFGLDTRLFNYFVIANDVSASLNIVAAKLELGTVSTLHLDPPMDHGVELLKCQRFFFAVTNFMQFPAYWQGTAFTGRVPTPVAMRSNPTLSTTDIRCYAIGSSTVITATGTNAFYDGVEILGTIASSQPVGSGSAFLNASGMASFSADL